MTLSDVQKFCTIVSCLGGPAYTPNELEWVTQVPSGKALIGWIAAQLHSEDDENSGQAVLSRIALEAEEVKLLQDSKPRANSDVEVDFSNYIPPSRQSSRTALIDNNAYTFEQEVLLLQHRLRQTKTISQQLRKTAQSITIGIDRVEGSISKKQEELEQLSLEVDTLISGTCSKSFDLLQCLQENLLPDVTSDTLTRCLKARKQIIQNVIEQLGAIDTWMDQLPSAAHLKLEALRLQHVIGLDTTGSSSLLLLAEESAYRQQLKSLMGTLEKADADEGEIYDILQRVTTVNEEVYPGSPKIVKELELAWNMDQLAILEARASVLDKASSQFHRSILPPLQRMHALLAEQQSVIDDTLAVIGTFRQEMDEVVHHVDAARIKACDPSRDLSSNFINHSSLENEMKTLLKDLQAVRPSDMPPLVLLNQNDILAELKALKEKEKSLDDQEERFGSLIPIMLNSLMVPHGPALDAMYAHSPVNSSAPFQLSPSVATLQHNAKANGDALAAQIQRLQKDLTILDDNRTQRKLESFVERWNSLFI
ncbi:uncharacterized protein C8R40DRAFT_1169252 [Lentinula edodes]|uniref:uncharacterized protein n=1 Tax=Lentinula edodes TaxID=5353 RepID=UPI001E8E6EEF|nr:uncharacterized protein C8R40DRAFT_1169252 [Lentinula edodes]KAH7876738.1 hypothetical protein C8R40DRAFT_1169252 [Lentinula edodes]